MDSGTNKDKYECELCLESYNYYDKKPYSLVPCGHTFCIKCFNSLKKEICPFCRKRFDTKIPNWEIVKRLPKPSIPIIYYQLQNKLTSLNKLTEDLSRINEAIKLEIKTRMDLLLNNETEATSDLEKGETDPAKQLQNYIDEYFSLNKEVEDNLIKTLNRIKSKIELDEYKYNEDNLKEIKQDIDKMIKFAQERICVNTKESDRLNIIFKSNKDMKVTKEFLKEIEEEFTEKKQAKPVISSLISPSNIVRPESNSSIDSYSSDTSSTDSEPIQLRTCQKVILGIVISVVFFLLMLYPIAMIIMGILYKNECPMNTLIPIWLTAGGSSGLCTELLLAILLVYVLYRSYRHRSFYEKLILIITLVVPIIIFILFNLAWFFAGNAWIYPIYRDVQFTNKTLTSTYCNQTIYYFSFWSLNLVYILIGLVLLVANIVCCCICFIKR